MSVFSNNNTKTSQELPHMMEEIIENNDQEEDNDLDFQSLITRKNYKKKIDFADIENLFRSYDAMHQVSFPAWPDRVHNSIKSMLVEEILPTEFSSLIVEWCTEWCTKNPEISLASIVVIGSQSSGKSTFVQRTLIRIANFLPVSENICTRMPIRVTMVKDMEKDKPLFAGRCDGFNPLDSTDDPFTVRNWIISVQDQFAPSRIISKEIKILIRWKDCLNLEFVDTPGIRVNGERNYPDAHIESQDVANNYLKDDNNLIIWLRDVEVEAANDNALSLILKSRLRKRKENVSYDLLINTIGVLTHMDKLNDTNLKLFDPMSDSKMGSFPLPEFGWSFVRYGKIFEPLHGSAILMEKLLEWDKELMDVWSGKQSLLTDYNSSEKFVMIGAKVLLDRMNILLLGAYLSRIRIEYNNLATEHKAAMGYINNVIERVRPLWNVLVRGAGLNAASNFSLSTFLTLRQNQMIKTCADVVATVFDVATTRIKISAAESKLLVSSFVEKSLKDINSTSPIDWLVSPSIYPLIGLHEPQSSLAEPIRFCAYLAMQSLVMNEEFASQSADLMSSLAVLSTRYIDKLESLCLVELPEEFQNCLQNVLDVAFRDNITIFGSELGGFIQDQDIVMILRSMAEKWIMDELNERVKVVWERIINSLLPFIVPQGHQILPFMKGNWPEDVLRVAQKRCGKATDNNHKNKDDKVLDMLKSKLKHRNSIEAKLRSNEIALDRNVVAPKINAEVCMYMSEVGDKCENVLKVLKRHSCHICGSKVCLAHNKTNIQGRKNVCCMCFEINTAIEHEKRVANTRLSLTKAAYSKNELTIIQNAFNFISLEERDRAISAVPNFNISDIEDLLSRQRSASNINPDDLLLTTVGVYACLQCNDTIISRSSGMSILSHLTSHITKCVYEDLILRQSDKPSGNYVETSWTANLTHTIISSFFADKLKSMLFALLEPYILDISNAIEKKRTLDGKISMLNDLRQNIITMHTSLYGRM